MTDSIVPNPPWLKNLQSLDGAELATAVSLLVKRPTIWRNPSSPQWTYPTGATWLPFGYLGPGDMAIVENEDGHVFSESGFLVYRTDEEAYYHFDFMVNMNLDVTAITVGLGLGSESTPFGGPLVDTTPFTVTTFRSAVVGDQQTLQCSGDFFSFAGQNYIPTVYQSVAAGVNWGYGFFSIRKITYPIGG